MWTKTFWLDTLERALATACEAALTYITVVEGFYKIDWLMALESAGVGFLYAVMKCILVQALADENSRK